MRKLTSYEIDTLTAQNNRCADWGAIRVAKSFTAENIFFSTFEGKVELGEGVKISNSNICNYSIGDRVIISNVAELSCTGLATFGNGTIVNTINENEGRAVKIYRNLTAQIAYLQALHRFNGPLIEALYKIADLETAKYSSDMGYIGADSKITTTKIIRNCFIDSNVVVEGTSIISNGTILCGAKVGVDVKATDFIAVQNCKIDMGATIESCFIGENVIISNGFTAAHSLFFTHSHCENGEACSLFAGPHTVSHHKSSLLIAGLFSFFNAGSGTNESNHLFKSGAVHQSIHLRGTKFASNGYVMSPAIEGAFTMVMGRHTHHHDTTDMPFSYLMEIEGYSWLMPGMNLRSYGTARDIAKWQKRDKRVVKRDNVDYIEYNPYLTWYAIRGRDMLKSFIESNPNAESYKFNNTLIRASIARKGLRLYDKYILGSLGAMISWCETLPKDADYTFEKWADIAGQYISLSALQKIEADIVSGALTTTDQISEQFNNFESNLTKNCTAWAISYITKCNGSVVPNFPLRTQIIEQGEQARAELQKIVQADQLSENSATMAVGYGLDCATEEQAEQDYKNVRGI